MKVPLLDVKAQLNSIRGELIESIIKTVDECNFIMGPQVSQFEKKIAEYTKAAYSIGCASGTDAILLSLKALNIGQGDEVITTPFTFFATAGAIANVGAKPVFCDILPDTFNIDPSLIEAKITPKTKCIIAVHLFGQCADMDAINNVAKKYNLAVIEDAAQSLGALYKGRMSGTIGDLGCYSFFPSKNLGCLGDGGHIVSNNKELAEKAAILRLHGSKPKYYHSIIGTNSRLDTIQAAALLVKLPYLESWAQARRKNASFYSENLKGISNITLPYIDPNCHHVFNQYTILTDDRDALMEYLAQKDIGTAIYYPLPLHIQKCFDYLGYSEGDFPVSEKTAKVCVSLPIYPELTDEQKNYVVETIKAYYK